LKSLRSIFKPKFRDYWLDEFFQIDHDKADLKEDNRIFFYTTDCQVIGVKIWASRKRLSLAPLSELPHLRSVNLDLIQFQNEIEFASSLSLLTQIYFLELTNCSSGHVDRETCSSYINGVKTREKKFGDENSFMACDYLRGLSCLTKLRTLNFQEIPIPSDFDLILVNLTNLIELCMENVTYYSVEEKEEELSMNEISTSSNQLNLSMSSSQDENSSTTTIEEGFSLNMFYFTFIFFLMLESINKVNEVIRNNLKKLVSFQL